MMEIRRIPLDHIEKFVSLLADAYPALPLTSTADRERSETRFRAIQEHDDSVDLYGAYRDDKLVGTMMFHSYTMTMLSTRIPVLGLGMVAVDLCLKKEKIAKEMVSFFLNHARLRGYHLVALYPFRPDFYRKMGFGIGTKMASYTLSPASLPKGSRINVSHHRYRGPICCIVRP